MRTQIVPEAHVGTLPEAGDEAARAHHADTNRRQACRMGRSAIEANMHNSPGVRVGARGSATGRGHGYERVTSLVRIVGSGLPADGIEQAARTNDPSEDEHQVRGLIRLLHTLQPTMPMLSPPPLPLPPPTPPPLSPPQNADATGHGGKRTALIRAHCSVMQQATHKGHRENGPLPGG